MFRLSCLAAAAGLLLATSPTAEATRTAVIPVSLQILGTCSVVQTLRTQPLVNCQHGEPVRITHDAPDGAWQVFF